MVFDNPNVQFIEAGKHGIPVEKRQFNWMQIPPSPGYELGTFWFRRWWNLHPIILTLFNRNSVFLGDCRNNPGIRLPSQRFPLLWHLFSVYGVLGMENPGINIKKYLKNTKIQFISKRVFSEIETFFFSKKNLIF